MDFLTSCAFSVLLCSFSIISESVEYFFAKRILGLKKYDLKPVGSQQHHQARRGHTSRKSGSHQHEGQVQGQPQMSCQAQPDQHDGRPCFDQSRSRHRRAQSSYCENGAQQNVRSLLGQSGVIFPRSFEGRGQGHLYHQFQDEDLDQSGNMKDQWSLQGQGYPECYNFRSPQDKRPMIPGHPSFQCKNSSQSSDNAVLRTQGVRQPRLQHCKSQKEEREFCSTVINNFISDHDEVCGERAQILHNRGPTALGYKAPQRNPEQEKKLMDHLLTSKRSPRNPATALWHEAHGMQQQWRPLLNSRANISSNQVRPAEAETASKQAEVPQSFERKVTEEEPSVSQPSAQNEGNTAHTLSGNTGFADGGQLTSQQSKPHQMRMPSIGEVVAANILPEDINFSELEPFEQATLPRSWHRPTAPVAMGHVAAVAAQQSKPRLTGRGRATVYGGLTDPATCASGTCSSPTQPKGRGVGASLPISALSLPRAMFDVSVPEMHLDGKLAPHPKLEGEKPPLLSEPSTPVSSRIAANLGQKPQSPSTLSPRSRSNPASPRSPQSHWERNPNQKPFRGLYSDTFCAQSNLDPAPALPGTSTNIPRVWPGQSEAPPALGVGVPAAEEWATDTVQWPASMLGRPLGLVSSC